MYFSNVFWQMISIFFTSLSVHLCFLLSQMRCGIHCACRDQKAVVQKEPRSMGDDSMELLCAKKNML